jgi:hypothetical protein
MTRRIFLALAVAALPLAFGGCAAGGAGAGGGGGDRDLLTIEDMAPYESMDVYSAIRRLRGNWFNTRSTSTMIDPNIGRNDPAQIQVYIDGVLRPDGVEALRGITVIEVREIRHLDGRDATMQYGTDHGAGAILVTTGR